MHSLASAHTLASLLRLDVRPDQPGLRHTPSEIMRQPEAWKQTFEVFQQHRDALRQFLAPLLTPDLTVVLLGAGTSDYIGWCVAPVLRQSWKCEVLVVASTDMITNADETLLSNRKYLFVSFSRSGDSPEGVAVLNSLLEQRPEAHHIIITCNPAGEMARTAAANDHAFSMVIEHANDQGLAMTSSFSSMVVLAQALAHVNDEEYAGILKRLVAAGNDLLASAPDVANTLAAEMWPSVCYVGPGALAATARECALKSLELTAGDLRALWESTLGLRHGPMSALNASTVFVALVSSDARRRAYDEDLVREIRASHVAAKIVTIGPLTDISLADYALGREQLNGIADRYRPPVDVIFGQIFGLFSSVHRHLLPDTPSPTGVISRVVRKFRIY